MKFQVLGYAIVKGYMAYVKVLNDTECLKLITDMNMFSVRTRNCFEERRQINHKPLSLFKTKKLNVYQYFPGKMYIISVKELCKVDLSIFSHTFYSGDNYKLKARLIQQI